MRVRLLFHLLLTVLLLALPHPSRAQQGGSETPPTATAPPTADAERKRQFLKAREEMHTVPATPPPSPTAPPRPKPRPRATPAPEPATPRATPMPVATPRPATPLPRPLPEVTPRPRPRTEPPREATPWPRVIATPPPATPRPAVTPAPAPAPVTIEKSGFEEEHGLEPATGGGGGWFTKWKYLSKGVRDALDRAPVQKRRWRYIVIHNSGTKQGNAKAFDYYHLHVRKMRNGLAYHFVVGNGTSSGDGQVEIGNRWTRQINGGHVHSDYLNNIALGICLVGDFNRTLPTQRQIAATEELVRYLRNRVGKIDRQQAILKAHREINPPRWPTDCPGDRFTNQMVHSLLDH